MQHQLNWFCLPDIFEGSVRTFGVRLSLHMTFLGEINHRVSERGISVGGILRGLHHRIPLGACIGKSQHIA